MVYQVSVRQETNCHSLDELVLLVNVSDASVISGGFTSPWQMVETQMKCHGMLAAFHQSALFPKKNSIFRDFLKL